jgi:hypothetical protein
MDLRLVEKVYDKDGLEGLGPASDAVSRLTKEFISRSTLVV